MSSKKAPLASSVVSSTRGNRLCPGRVAALATLAFGLLFTNARADFQIKGPTNGTPMSVILSNCPPNQIGTSTLDPSPVIHLGPADATSTLATTFAADKPTQFPNWTLAYGGGALSGILTINTYIATDRPDAGPCNGGAKMDATYAPGTNDPANLTFIQVFTDNYGGGTHVDPFPNDDTEPFYYTAAERTAHGLNFLDNPHNPCTMLNFTYTNEFFTYLVSFSGTTATVYDGFEWGYDVRCTTVPEPSSLVNLGMAAGLSLGVLGSRARRRVAVARDRTDREA